MKKNDFFKNLDMDYVLKDISNKGINEENMNIIKETLLEFSTYTYDVGFINGRRFLLELLVDD